MMPANKAMQPAGPKRPAADGHRRWTDLLAMFTPAKIFGSAAARVRSTEPVVLGHCEIGTHRVQALRYDFADFQVVDRAASDGYFLVYSVAQDSKVTYLQQVRTQFYVPDGVPAPGDRRGRLPSGDGSSAPQWHKSDRCWPELAGEPFAFVGQGYHDLMVVYLFRSPRSVGEYLAIWTDHLDRQDAEEHYRLEEARDRRSRRTS